MLVGHHFDVTRQLCSSDIHEASRHNFTLTMEGEPSSSSSLWNDYISSLQSKASQYAQLNANVRVSLGLHTVC